MEVVVNAGDIPEKIPVLVLLGQPSAGPTDEGYGLALKGRCTQHPDVPLSRDLCGANACYPCNRTILITERDSGGADSHREREGSPAMAEPLHLFQIFF